LFLLSCDVFSDGLPLLFFAMRVFLSSAVIPVDEDSNWSL